MAYIKLRSAWILAFVVNVLLEVQRRLVRELGIATTVIDKRHGIQIRGEPLNFRDKQDVIASFMFRIGAAFEARCAIWQKRDIQQPGLNIQTRKFVGA